ncbi:ferredoxin [Mycobacterium antarcticum]|uniref:ferredoxin n=1 Tax=unclassified Mycolicibacterium TaxID=2636767 RepID=UPI002393C551|nr:MULTISPECIES: ferredoxin [unclassified Mycolicibacterium]BDX31074.1 ferredoxin [Mycolicibacterium sp. TUM20985]GLP74424.1 ferredoxin [Mycolicibacterium sp. TUM20983]GLP80221.1 ferredoxin [Mycolicibacterium sp. TUM20984]
MKVRTDADKCVSSGMCVSYAAEVFDQNDDDGVVILLVEEPAAEFVDGTRKAAAACPALAIHLEE